MNFTRRYWAGVVLGSFLGLASLVLSEPLLLVGSAGIFGWLLARQYLFFHEVAEIATTMNVEQSVGEASVTVDDRVPVTLDVHLPRRAEATVRVEAPLPAGATGAGRRPREVVIRAGEREGTTSFDLRWPIAGRHQLPRAAVTVTDREGLFSETTVAGEPTSVAVEPRGIRDLRIRAGSNATAPLADSQKKWGGKTDAEPTDIREYVPGDRLAHIDWKATARLNRLHVREFGVQTEPTTAFVFDHRSTMATGASGRTELDYARHVALGLERSIRGEYQRLGLYTVGDDGPTARYPPQSTTEHYAAIRRRLYALKPGRPDERFAPGTTTRGWRPPRRGRRLARLLDGDDSTFGRRIRPFFADPGTRRPHNRDRDRAKPLYRTVRATVDRLSGAALIAIFTDDSDRGELYETVRAARNRENDVLVFLTPAVLFEPDGLDDLHRAYERLADFDRFRRSLSQMDRVTAYEVGPGERLDALLAHGRRESTAVVAR